MRLLAVLLVFFISSSIQGQTAPSYPSRSVRMLLAFPPGGTSEQYAAYIRSELQRWTRVVKDAGAKAD